MSRGSLVSLIEGVQLSFRWKCLSLFKMLALTQALRGVDSKYLVLLSFAFSAVWFLRNSKVCGEEDLVCEFGVCQSVVKCQWVKKTKCGSEEKLAKTLFKRSDEATYSAAWTWQLMRIPYGGVFW